ncbi:hypothetical protein [Helicobacter ibis]|uniref:Uncharacterized protein n=1 Tax=Helicobacter ibis TaxID=2962633 RepID=A0ABT4VGA9_9HELI|nr:hypothetical protein [Helicobacter ibis]MDA3969056.1 hypothetical protein [Helicobacter ibis]
MHTLDFFVLIWILLALTLLPFVGLSAGFVAYQAIKEYLAGLENKDKLLKDINYLIGRLKNNESAERMNEAIEAFKKHFMPFGDISKESKDYQNRMDFISALAWCNGIDIDEVVKHREELVKLNSNFKKEIETIVGAALKNREENKKK